jgi:mRNA-degrading endonuclease RelE of RelBE toxin-antitoxin system
MKAVFIEATLFERYRDSYLTEEQYTALQNELLAFPDTGDVIQGSGGLRKIRFATGGRGKRGGVRVIYYYLVQKQRFYLLTIYAKNEVSDLTKAEIKQLRAFVEDWKHEQT